MVSYDTDRHDTDKYVTMRTRRKGFSLLELMVAVVIVAILALVAYPTYTQHVRKAARKEMLGLMLEAAGRLERTRSQIFKYQSLTVAGTSRYSLGMNVPDDGATYTLTAIPQGNQSADACGTLTLDNLGVWTFTKDATAVPQADCF